MYESHMREGNSFSLFVCPHPGSTPSSSHNTSTGPMSFAGGYPSQVQMGGAYPGQLQIGGTPTRDAVPPHQVRMGGTPVSNGVPPPGHDGGYPSQGWGTWIGQHIEYLTRRVVCLLRSRRRTFLFTLSICVCITEMY